MDDRLKSLTLAWEEQELKKRFVTPILAMLMSLFLASTFVASIAPLCQAQANSDPTFSIIWITDTQYLSQSYPSYFDNLTQWIVANKGAYNVQMVIHTGDIVNDEANQQAWANANKSMSTLLNNGVPYCWDAGNHDYDGSSYIGNHYVAFDPKALQSKVYWISNDSEGMDTAVHFDINGWDCLVLNIAYHASDAVLTWANIILDKYPQSHVIVATHAFIDQKCRCDAWAKNFQKTVLDTHPNVFLTLNGHYHPSADNRTEVGGRYELVFNQQDTSEEKGADTARILTFNPANGTIHVQTYNQLTNQFIQEQADHFTLNTTFHNDEANGQVPEFSSSTYTAVLLFTFVATVVAAIAKNKTKKRLRQASFV